MNHENQTLDEALNREFHLWDFARSGNMLPADCPPFSGSVVLDPATLKFKIRLVSTAADFKGVVQPAEADTVEALKIEVEKICAFSIDQMKNYIKEFVPAENQAQVI
jgi:hypothetical protein